MRKVPVKNAYPPPQSRRKIFVPPLGVAVKNGYPPPLPGCRMLLRAAGANHPKGASRVAGKLRERNILLLSVFWCV